MNRDDLKALVRYRDGTVKKVTRSDVADYAAYCVGTCHGDFSPEAKAAEARVLEDDHVYEQWLAQLREHESTAARSFR